MFGFRTDDPLEWEHLVFGSRVHKKKEIEEGI